MFIGKDFTPAVIDEVQKDSPAEIAGLKKNDIILEIDNNKVESILDVSKFIAMSTSDFVDLKFQDWKRILLKVKPNLVESEDNLGNKLKKRMVGIKLSAYNDKINHVKLGPAQALVQSFNEVYFVTVSSLKYLGSMIVGKRSTLSQFGRSNKNS